MEDLDFLCPLPFGAQSMADLQCPSAHNARLSSFSGSPSRVVIPSASQSTRPNPPLLRLLLFVLLRDQRAEFQLTRFPESDDCS